MADVNNTEPSEAAPAKKGISPLILAAVAGLAAAGSGAAAIFLAPSPSASPSTSPEPSEAIAKAASDNAAHGEENNNSHTDHNDKKSAHKGEKEKHAKNDKSDGHGGKKKTDAADSDSFSKTKISFAGKSAFVEFSPLVISMPGGGRSRHLKIGLVIETSPDDAEYIKNQTFVIYDVLNTYLRSIDSLELQSPTMISDLKKQIQYRIELVAPGVEIHKTLITEFLLT